MNPPEGMSLEALVNELQTVIEPELRELLPADGTIQYAGSVQDLERAVGTLGANFLIAIGLLVLIMAGLFRSLKDAVFVIISIPLAAVGGVFAITIVNLVNFQPLDLLGMIGFIILLGLVVNNAILLVAQTRAAEARGLPRTEEIYRGMAAAIVGGMAVSTLFTLLLLPSLLQLAPQRRDDGVLQGAGTTDNRPAENTR